ncbi:MAG: hypothetical protein H6670_01960 [Anaerolineaceae bacterium]|nr:hypothetical protein [Anaerolineaceae bacterium]
MYKYLSILSAMIGLLILPCVHAQEDNAYETHLFSLEAIPASVGYPAGWLAYDYLLITIFSEAPIDIENTITNEIAQEQMFIIALDVKMLSFWNEFEPLSDIYEIADLFEQDIGDSISKTTFDRKTILDGLDTTNALQSSGLAEDGSAFATYIIMEYGAETSSETSYMIFYAAGPADRIEESQDVIMHMASTFVVGDAVEQEPFIFDEPIRIPLDDDEFARSIIGDWVVLGNSCTDCSDTTNIFSLATGERRVIDAPPVMPSASFAGYLTLPENTPYWVFTAEGEVHTSDYREILIHIAPNGEILQEIELVKNDAYQATLDVEINGNDEIYILYRRQVSPSATQSSDYVLGNQLELRLQILSATGELLNDFLVNYDDYAATMGTAMLSVGPKSQIYVLNSSSNQGVMIFDKHGNLLQTGVARGQMQIFGVKMLEAMPDGTFFIGLITQGGYEALAHYDQEGQLIGIHTLFLEQNLPLMVLDIRQVSQGRYQIVSPNYPNLITITFSTDSP